MLGRLLVLASLAGQAMSGFMSVNVSPCVHISYPL